MCMSEVPDMRWGSKASHLCAPLVLSMRLQGILSNDQREVVIDPVWHALCGLFATMFPDALNRLLPPFVQQQQHC